ncbi:hypothetical protein [Actinocatenispora rupis]|uniref:DUF4190 domain-containing protein n=1 Tax=Actinocatenispora rupis TaxID=519421 RepID=A0A8J3NHE1_9ACTN|nr:hypothetical protein [Actinocatenispora rupis]GID15854.1 hypothetical protein Aru02nite_67430 [Actinocatenispora rupis]
MTEPPHGGYPSGDESTARRLPLRGAGQTATRPNAGSDPWNTEGADDNPFAGTALGALGENKSAVNPFDKTTPGTSSVFDDDEDRDRKARTSFPITIGLICTVVGACAGLTAVLAPVAIALGGFGVLLSLIGLFTARRRHVGGRLVAVLSILIGLAAVGLGVAEHLGTFSWLNADLPQHARNWLNGKVPGLHG